MGLDINIIHYPHPLTSSTKKMSKRYFKEIASQDALHNKRVVRESNSASDNTERGGNDQHPVVLEDEDVDVITVSDNEDDIEPVKNDILSEPNNSKECGLSEETYRHMMDADVMKEFPIMEPAVAYRALMNMLFIFGRDKMNSARQGAKSYMVAALMIFWRYYCALEPYMRVFYETISEDVPCHIHMDVEFLRDTNKGLEDSVVVECLMEELFAFLEQSLEIAREGVRVVDLDSCSPKKFSHHYVVKLPRGGAVRNNYHVGALIRNMQLNTFYRGHTRENSPLWVWDRKEKNFTDHDTKVFVVDMGIYTMRRQFRLCYSTKKGENRFLVPAGTPHTTSAPQQSPHSSSTVPPKAEALSFETFKDTLIQCISKPSIIYTCANPDGSEPVSSSHTSAHLGGYRPKSKRATCVGQTLLNGDWFSERSYIAPGGANSSSKSSAIVRSTSMPAIAKRVIYVIEKVHGVQSYSPMYFEEHMVLRMSVYDKKCSILGGEHKSNNTKYIVRFRDGTYKKACQDPDCQGKYMWVRDLPGDIREEVMKYAVDMACGRIINMKPFWGDMSVMSSEIIEYVTLLPRFFIATC